MKATVLSFINDKITSTVTNTSQADLDVVQKTIDAVNQVATSESALLAIEEMLQSSDLSVNGIKERMDLLAQLQASLHNVHAECIKAKDIITAIPVVDEHAFTAKVSELNERAAAIQREQPLVDSVAVTYAICSNRFFISAAINIINGKMAWNMKA